jgi:hypothetical protein
MWQVDRTHLVSLDARPDDVGVAPAILLVKDDCARLPI